ncbi:MAG: type VI secretion system ATPase TssH [SAR324 cluster bacterium]|nr:type VI secretion system ATPase TssH [SAR324 cluster bacterium]
MPIKPELDVIIAKLSPVCQHALESAAGLCVAQTHYHIEIEHFLMKLLEVPTSDIDYLVKYYHLSSERLSGDLALTLEKFKRGCSRVPSLSSQIIEIFQDAWLIASLTFKTQTIRSSHILLALVENRIYRQVLHNGASVLLDMEPESLLKNMHEITRNSLENPEIADGQDQSFTENEQETGHSSTPFLDQFTIDLTRQAQEGKIDPIHGRSGEIRQLVDILTRRRQNNPILIGEAGVGKTAVVEGFALRIVKDDVPPPLRNISLRILDIGLLQAGAGIQGEFEKRMKSLIAEVKNSTKPIILFIDEAHTIIGAGGAEGVGDVANLLKPALARGELRTIGATTLSEYKQYIEKDPALARRFQPVKVDEPAEDVAISMLRGMKSHLENYHKVRILDEALQDTVHLSHRYITGRHLPDKAISVLDTACARVAIGQNATPAQIEDIQRTMAEYELKKQILEGEQFKGKNHKKPISELAKNLNALQKELKQQNNRWQKELKLVSQISQFHKELEETPASDKKKYQSLRHKLDTSEKKLALLQGEMPLVPLCVDKQVVASVISGWTGIPMGKMLAEETRTILDLKNTMATRLIGQDHALETIVKRIQTSRAGLDDPNKPIGVFLLTGPSGVGKTETAATLADLLYGGEQNMVVINMSEYQEAHTVSTLRGSPPGYVGYGKGGILTEAVRRNPYSIVLLDEVEKAHPDVLEVFYQVFDKGFMEDGEGIPINFRNTIIFLTSNIGSQTILKACGVERPVIDIIQEKIRAELLGKFNPAFLGRLVTVPYYPLSGDNFRNIIQLKLAKVKQRFKMNHQAELKFDDEIIDYIQTFNQDIAKGARLIDEIITHTLLPEMSIRILEHQNSKISFTKLIISFNDRKEFVYNIR